METKIDEILQQLRLLAGVPQKLDTLADTVKEIQDSVRTLKHDVADHDDRIVKLEQEVLALRNSDNSNKQQLRSLTLRIIGLPQTPEEKDDLRGRVYDVIKPILVAAKAAKDLPTVPQAASIFETVFRPYQGEHGKSPPPVILKITSRAVKLALLKHRKHLVPPEQGAGSRAKILLVEDLTPENLRVLNLLTKSKTVEKAWSVEGVMRALRNCRLI